MPEPGVKKQDNWDKIQNKSKTEANYKPPFSNTQH